jgi:hypothetical protein
VAVRITRGGLCCLSGLATGEGKKSCRERLVIVYFSGLYADFDLSHRRKKKKLNETEHFPCFPTNLIYLNERVELSFIIFFPTVFMAGENPPPKNSFKKCLN